MQLKHNAIVLSRRELACFAAFSGKDSSVPTLYGVAIRLCLQDGEPTLSAYATDGPRCVRAQRQVKADALRKADVPTEWLVPLDVVRFAMRSLKGEQEAHFEIGPRFEIERFRIWDLNDELIPYKLEEVVLAEPVPAQTAFAFDKIDELFRDSDVEASDGWSIRLDESSLKAAMTLYGASCRGVLRFHVPVKPLDPVLVTVDQLDELETSWQATLQNQTELHDMEGGDLLAAEETAPAEAEETLQLTPTVHKRVRKGAK